MNCYERLFGEGLETVSTEAAAVAGKSYGRVMHRVSRNIRQKHTAVRAFLELEKRINDDKHHIGVRARMSRSNMDINILSLIREVVITLDDLADFSDELQNQMRLIVERTSMIFDDFE